ncbi:MAG TPA: hypothetical protein VNM92_00375 [Thermoanaerobaculia bacterium]|nr:hypothetical protein [Thermoanaerobaculia bacterium]
MAETQLRLRGVPEDQWGGMAFVHGENTPETMWASVVIGIERRGVHWVVTKLDRREEPLHESETGLRASHPGST